MSEEKKVRARPEALKGKTFKVATGCGSLYVTVNTLEDGTAFEVFASRGKQGGCSASFSEGMCRLISLALRSGIEIREIVKQLNKIRCPNPHLINGGIITSCSDGIASVLKLFIGKDKGGDLDGAKAGDKVEGS